MLGHKVTTSFLPDVRTISFRSESVIFNIFDAFISPSMLGRVAGDHEIAWGSNAFAVDRPKNHTTSHHCWALLLPTRFSINYSGVLVNGISIGKEGGLNAARTYFVLVVISYLLTRSEKQAMLSALSMLQSLSRMTRLGPASRGKTFLTSSNGTTLEVLSEHEPRRCDLSAR